jgi:hypothetical protein
MVSLLVTLLSAWFKLKHDNERQNDKIKALNQRANDYYRECKEEFMNAKNGRVAIRRDFDSNLTANNIPSYCYPSIFSVHKLLFTFSIVIISTLIQGFYFVVLPFVIML